MATLKDGCCGEFRFACVAALSVALAMAASFASGCGQCEEDVFEGMDVLISGTGKMEVAASICPDGDEDHFEIELQDGETLDLELEAGEIEANLHDPAGAVVASGPPVTFENTTGALWEGEMDVASENTGEYHLHFTISGP